MTAIGPSTLTISDQLANPAGEPLDLQVGAVDYSANDTPCTPDALQIGEKIAVGYLLSSSGAATLEAVMFLPAGS